MNLVNEKETYEYIYENDEGESKAVFTLKRLSYGEVVAIQDVTSILDDKDRIAFLGGTASRMKLKFGLVSWKNIFIEGKEAVCSETNKDKLPSEVAFWIIKKIEDLNKLGGISEQERKNS